MLTPAGVHAPGPWEDTGRLGEGRVQPRSPPASRPETFSSTYRLPGNHFADFKQPLQTAEGRENGEGQVNNNHKNHPGEV